MAKNAHSGRERISQHAIEKLAVSYQIKQTLRSQLGRHGETPERLGMPSEPPIRRQRWNVAKGSPPRYSWDSWQFSIPFQLLRTLLQSGTHHQIHEPFIFFFRDIVEFAIRCTKPFFAQFLVLFSSRFMERQAQILRYPVIPSSLLGTIRPA